MPPPGRRRPAPRTTSVVRTEHLSPHLVRVVLGGAALRQGFAPVHADAYVKLLFLTDGVTYPEPFDLEAVRASLPQEHWPRLRTYTVRSWDAGAAEVTIDFVVHGDEGVAGPWAAQARPGDVMHVQGPGGGYSPDQTARAHLLVGDESALPAIAAVLEQLPEDADARVFVEVPERADELDLGREVHWLHRDGGPVGAALLAAVQAQDLPVGTAAFVHGEAGFVKVLRRWLRVEQQVPAEQLSISGYWRLGVDDEGWRAGKAAWLADAEADEHTAGAGVPTA